MTSSYHIEVIINAIHVIHVLVDNAPSHMLVDLACRSWFDFNILVWKSRGVTTKQDIDANWVRGKCTSLPICHIIREIEINNTNHIRISHPIF